MTLECGYLIPVSVLRKPDPKGRGTVKPKNRHWAAAVVRLLMVGGLLFPVGGLRGLASEPATSDWTERLEAAVRADDPAAAAAALEATATATATRDDGSPDPVRDANQGMPIDRFWRAQAYALTGRAAEASAMFTSLTADPKNTYFQEAVLSHGALWAARGETARALQALAPGLVTDDPARAAAVRLRMAELHLAQSEITEARTILQPAAPSLERAALEARAAWMQGRMEEAAQLAGPVAAQAPAGAARDTARLVQARVKAAGGQILEADRGLLEWVRAEPTTVPLAAVMLALEEFNGLEAEEVNTLLTEWQGDPRSALAPPAAYGRAAAAARQGQTGPAAEAFAAFAAAHDTHPLAPAARFRSVELALAAGMPEQARTWAESWRAHPSLASGSAEAAQAAFAAGLAAWQANDAAAATTAFEEAAQHAPDQGIKQAARLNAALCAVQAGSTPPSSGLELWPDAAATILFEAGLHGARTHRPEATSWLEKFLATHAGTNAGIHNTGKNTPSPATRTDPRPAAAWTALAELELARPPPPPTPPRPSRRPPTRPRRPPRRRHQHRRRRSRLAGHRHRGNRRRLARRHGKSRSIPHHLASVRPPGRNPLQTRLMARPSRPLDRRHQRIHRPRRGNRDPARRRRPRPLPRRPGRTQPPVARLTGSSHRPMARRRRSG